MGGHETPLWVLKSSVGLTQNCKLAFNHAAGTESGATWPLCEITVGAYTVVQIAMYWGRETPKGGG